MQTGIFRKKKYVYPLTKNMYKTNKDAGPVTKNTVWSEGEKYYIIQNNMTWRDYELEYTWGWNY